MLENLKSRQAWGRNPDSGRPARSGSAQFASGSRTECSVVGLSFYLHSSVDALQQNKEMEKNIMKRHWLSLEIAIFGLTLIFNQLAASAPVFEASGTTPADIQTAVDAFRNFLGQPNNGVGGT